MTSQNDDPPASQMQLLRLYYQPAFLYRYEYNKLSDPTKSQPIERPNMYPVVHLWLRHPAEINYDPRGAFPINLHCTPGAWLKEPTLDNIEIDDHTNNGGYTTIGPLFPQAYGSGGMYISQDRYDDAVRHDKAACRPYGIPSRPSAPAPDETMIIQWIPGPQPKGASAFKRYHGFHATQLEQAQYSRLWIVWHSGTWESDYPRLGPYEHWRAPRKLWIPDNVNLEAQGAFASPRAHGQNDPEPPLPRDRPIYLEQTYATFVADLAVPKQPSASGERFEITSSDPVRPYVCPRPPTGARPEPLPPNLNIVSQYAPGEIYLIKNKLHHYLEVREGETLVDALSHYLERIVADKQHSGVVPQFTNLDIIGHSRSGDRVLKVGELALTSRVAKQQFHELYQRGILRALGIQAIRLLGCRTASPPRGEHVVRMIWNQTGLEVYATRSDLFAVHFEGAGLRCEAELLLANYDVVTQFGAGDLPPRDDYPASLPSDDDDEDDSATVRPDPPTPDRFSLTALSDVNAAAVSAHNYLFWRWEPWQFDELTKMLYGDQAERDNRLLRAQHEVLLPIAACASDISDFRSFDLFLCEDKMGNPPRLRVNYDGMSYAFRFRNPEDLPRRLCKIGIAVDDASQPKGK